MDVTIIGAGNVGTVLGRQFVRSGHRIGQVWSRNSAHAAGLAAELGAENVESIALLDKNADLYLVAVTDDALADVASQLSLGSNLVVHTAGSVLKQVLQATSSSYGVLWPMKMIRRNMKELGPVTIVVDGNTPAVTDRIAALAAGFSTTVTRADDDLRLKLHMLAAVTSNFPNHLYRLAADYCEQEKIDFSLLYPIIEDTATRIRSAHPATVQAGPAYRRDLQTLEKHEQLLRQYPKLAELYEVISRNIMQG